MKKVFQTAILALALLASNAIFAQVSHGGQPLFNHSNTKATVNIHYLPTMSNDKLMNQDVESVKGGTPLRIGMGQNCNIDVLAEATVTKDMRGMHYTLAVQSPEANFVGLTFSTFDLAEGAELFIYDQTGEFVLGKYVKSDVMDGGRFLTQSIPGSTAYIEYNVPAGVEPGSLVISSVIHGYKDIFGMIDGIYDDAEAGLKGSHGQAEGTCHPDVACPEGDGWRDQIRSVVAIEVIANTNYGQVPFMCSGALINNTRQDRTPYVLSAYHCQDQESMLGDLEEYYPNISLTGIDFIAYFLYQKNTCGGRFGAENNSVVGADIIAKYSYSGGSDMLLLKLKSDVPDDYKPYYAGWDRNEVANPEPGVCIHHPGGDFKKISLVRVIRSAGKFYEVGWLLGNENKGVTEQGSSGSPLFNADKRIIGQLYAGASFCNKAYETDYYGRVSASWNGGGLATNRLKTYLDPDNTDVTTLDGLNYTNEGISIVDNVKNLAVYPNPTNGVVNFDIDYIGTVNYKVFDLTGRCVKEGTTVLTSTVQSIDLGSLPKGTYTLSVFTGSAKYSAQVIRK